MYVGGGHDANIKFSLHMSNVYEKNYERGKAKPDATKSATFY